MKKLIAMLLCLTLILSFAACAAKDEPSIEDEPVVEDVPAVEDEPAVEEDPTMNQPAAMPEETPVVDDMPAVMPEEVPEEMLAEANSYAETSDPEILAVRKRYEELLTKHRAEIAKYADKVRAAGGLFIIGTERHESRRIDNQLRGYPERHLGRLR